MGFSRASKNLLHGITSGLKENKRKNDLAASVMDKKHPDGWAQSATNMAEFKQVKKSLPKRSGGGGSW